MLRARRWYHILSRDEKARAAAEKRRAKAKKVISRPIRHPNFKNLSNLQAIAAMHDADVGACLFRPSEKGTDQITLTIKVRLSLRCRQAAMLRRHCHKDHPQRCLHGLLSGGALCAPVAAAKIGLWPTPMVQSSHAAPVCAGARSGADSCEQPGPG